MLLRQASAQVEAAPSLGHLFVMCLENSTNQLPGVHLYGSPSLFLSVRVMFDTKTRAHNCLNLGGHNFSGSERSTLCRHTAIYQ